MTCLLTLACDLRSKILKRWVSRFDVWPYLETFTIDVAHELRAALGSKVSPSKSDMQFNLLKIEEDGPPNPLPAVPSMPWG